MAAPKSALPNRTVGLYLLLAVVVGAIAFLTALQSGAPTLHAVTVGVIVLSLIAGLEAAVTFYRKTGGLPGPAVSLGTILQFLQVAALLTVPSLLSNPITYLGMISWALLFLTVVAEELLGIPLSVPGLGSSAPVNTTATVTTAATTSVTTSPPADSSSAITSLDHLIGDLGSPPKP